MESEAKKIKIVLICHFMNTTLQRALGMDGNEKELAPWISLEIEEIKKRNDIELHVISPFYKITRNKSFSDHDIHYHCIKIGIPFIPRHWPSYFRINAWTNFYLFNLQVRRLVNKIKPDLVNLSGAENAYYSSSVLGIKGYPILVTIQGFVSLNSEKVVKNPIVLKRIQIEEKIFKNLKYFAIEATFMEKFIRNFNPDARMFWFHLPFAKTNVTTNVSKEYDIVFFARVTKMKGIEDLIKAVSISRAHIPDIKLCVIGESDIDYQIYLNEMIENLNLKDNIVFKGFVSTQTTMHKEVVKAKISVLPTYNDTIPGTIVESMLLGVPVISYNTGGIPDLNKDGENIILVEQGNVVRLADEIIRLLTNDKLRDELAAGALKYASEEFDNTHSVNLMIEAYKAVIEDFRKMH
jgi:glycosyltransferase involved in cell wall biosynthesis